MAKLSKIQVPPNNYFNLKYASLPRWISYWHQIDQVLAQDPKSVLEIGVGNRTVSDYLKKNGIKVTTCDFDKSLKPDVVADVLALPFAKDTFDTVLCAEVLEHLPFKNFAIALNQIYRVARVGAVISLPHASLTNLYLGFKLIPFIPKKELAIKVDFPFKHKFLGEHYWEIGKKGYPLSKIERAIKRSGFKIKKSFYPKENPYHHFFILNKGAIDDQN